MSELARGESSKLILKFREEKAKDIPFIITDQDLNLVSYNRIPEDVIKDPEKFRRKLNELTEEA